MPIYEFYCRENNTVYSFLAKSMAYGDATPRCPENDAYSMEKRISGFAFIGKAKDPSEEGGLDDIDDAKMEGVMAELERDMAGFDEDNPDPKQMAHLMRKMSSLTGEKLPGEMEEMVRRLESGEDPEKLEEEFGDSLDDLGDDFEGGEADGRMRRLQKRLLGPKKDPNLYDMAEYCD
jgi:NTP pyrophosphatase (non-canonical NTP hydrolase)